MVVDICAGNQENLSNYRNCYREYRKLAADLNEAGIAVEK